VRLQGAGPSVAIGELVVVRADRGVQVMPTTNSWRIDSVEHLMAALAGLGIRNGLAATVTGPEVPLLDGGARQLAESIGRYGLCSHGPPLRVVRAGEVQFGASSYRFDVAARVEVEVAVDFSVWGLGPEQARWEGDPGSFLEEIAPARTFGFVSEHASLLAADRARGADPASVLVFDTAGRVVAPGPPAAPGELARHKLLDLLGDFYLLGGPPVGRLRAQRPGHEANLAALRRAIADKIVA
jgi:UDP-3-O-[3-hydroxymyristoyl] N-acetylglucosamine deacetylase